MNTLIINKNDLRHNIDTIKKQINKENYTIIGVVKGNGYGLGIKEYSSFLIDNGINMLAVATNSEAVELRKYNKNVDILNMSCTSLKEEIQELLDNNIIITIGSKTSAEIANEIAKTGKTIRAHIKIDTGFGRYGFIYQNKDEIVNTIKNLHPNIKVEGIFSHFSLAYYKNNASTINQYNNFLDVIKSLEDENINIKMKHICNSPAFINFPEMRLNAARIGSAFLGRVDVFQNIGLKKIGELQSQVTDVNVLPKNFNVGYLNTYKTKNETKIAIVPVGHKDGYNITIKEDMLRTVDKLRNLKHGLTGLLKKQTLKITINNKEYDIIGKVGMYHVTVNITGSEVKVRRYCKNQCKPIIRR
ncbi:MAG: alanine racemase [Clostridia bacterium]|nr:alanine racemase [Clostridia bacterium]